MAKRKDRFVIGGTTQHPPVHGIGGAGDWIWPALASRALEVWKDEKQNNGRRLLIYKLVPVTVAEVAAQAKRDRKARKEADDGGTKE